MKWYDALNYAAAVFLYSIFWSIIGSILIFISFTLGFGSILANVLPIFGLIRESSTYTTLSAIFSIVLFVAGFFIIFLGTIAAIIKMLSEAVAEEIEARQIRKNQKNSKPDISPK